MQHHCRISEWKTLPCCCFVFIQPLSASILSFSISLFSSCSCSISSAPALPSGHLLQPAREESPVRVPALPLWLLLRGTRPQCPVWGVLERGEGSRVSCRLSQTLGKCSKDWGDKSKISCWESLEWKSHFPAGRCVRGAAHPENRSLFYRIQCCSVLPSDKR